MNRIYGVFCDSIKVLLKSLLGEKNSLTAMWKLVSTSIGCISSIFAFSVLLKNLVGFDKAEAFCKEHWILLVIIGIFASLIHNHERLYCKGTMDNDDLQIVVKVNDLFSVRATSFVIPTNTFFRTVMEGEYISPQSVQGAFQLKYFKKNRGQLDKLIAVSLAKQGITGEVSLDVHGTVKKYPIGTVAKIDYKGKHFYFVAICDVNEFGKPVNQSYSNVNIALDALLKIINKLGHCDDLAMPLIGTGRAAIREATIENVIEDTVDRFLSIQYKPVQKLTICIRPKDYLDGKVDLKKIRKYVEYKCEFK